MASSMLSNLFEHISKYETIRISSKEWLMRKKTITQNRRKGFILNFDVLQSVSLQNTGKDDIKVLQCTCGYSEVYGLPCVDSLVVADSLNLHGLM